MAEKPRSEIQRARSRTKVNVDVEVLMKDGARLTGSVYIGLDERVLDLLNDPKPFFPLRQDKDNILILNKSAIATCKPLETPG